MSAAGDAGSDAVREARRADFANGVRLASLEGLVARRVPTLRSRANTAAWLGLAKGAAMIAPFAGLLAPVGGTDFGWSTESEGFRGQGLLTVSLICFAIGAIGQLWILIDWWRAERQRETAGRVAAAIAVVAAGLALWWFSSLMLPSDFQAVALPIALTGLIGAVSLVAQLVASSSTTRWEGRQLALAQRMRELPSDEQAALREERRAVLEVLQERQLLDASESARADAAPLGEWWRIDRERLTQR
ncbi:MAG: hypothetical protein ACQEWM_02885 [Actinomycetota bacterium]